MKEEKIYLVSADIADRAQCKESSYRTKDGRYIVSERALRDFRFRMTAEEFVSGLDATIISGEEASRLAAENNYLTGTRGLETSGEGSPAEVPESPAPVQEEPSAGQEQETPSAGQEENVEVTENQEEEE